jgi:hypothetical protein
MSLRTYWQKHVLPLRQDDLTNLGSNEVQFKLEESLNRDGTSLAQENKARRMQKRASRLSRDSTSDMFGNRGDDLDSQQGGRTPMNVKEEDDGGFPFDGSKDVDTPVNRSPPRDEDGGIRNRAFYVKAVEILIELAELVKVRKMWDVWRSASIR